MNETRIDESCKGCNGECYSAYPECESCPYELRDVDNAVLEKFNNVGLPNYVKSVTRKDYKMYYNGVKIKIGNKIYYPDTVDWKQNPDAFPELEISTRISPYNLDTTSNLSITNVIFNPQQLSYSGPTRQRLLLNAIQKKSMTLKKQSTS